MEERQDCKDDIIIIIVQTSSFYDSGIYHILCFMCVKLYKIIA